MSYSLRRILSWIVTWIVPAVLVLSAVRIVLHPWYVEFEYLTPGFPEDPYGFTMEERLRYARIAVDYLVNDAGVGFLGDLRFPEGEQVPSFSCQFMDDCTKMYNERELKHMVDVKNVVQIALRVLYAGLGLLALGGVWAWVGGWRDEYLWGFRRGGWLALGLIGLILLLVLAAFGAFFVFFHDVFFDPGTWVFYRSDTLIRLFPERFWRDTFLIVGGIAAVLGALAVWVPGKILSRKAHEEPPESF